MSVIPCKHRKKGKSGSWICARIPSEISKDSHCDQVHTGKIKEDNPFGCYQPEKLEPELYLYEV